MKIKYVPLAYLNLPFNLQAKGSAIRCSVFFLKSTYETAVLNNPSCQSIRLEVHVNIASVSFLLYQFVVNWRNGYRFFFQNVCIALSIARIMIKVLNKCVTLIKIITSKKVCHTMLKSQHKKVTYELMRLTVG